MSQSPENSSRKTNAAPHWLVITIILGMPFISLLFGFGIFMNDLGSQDLNRSLISGVAILAVEIQNILVTFFWRRVPNSKVKHLVALMLVCCLWAMIINSLFSVLFAEVMVTTISLFLVTPVILGFSFLATFLFVFLIPTGKSSNRVSHIVLISAAIMMFIAMVGAFGKSFIVPVADEEESFIEDMQTEDTDLDELTGSPENSVCETGTMQSPIDINRQSKTHRVKVNYRKSRLRLLNDGSNVTINYDPGSYVTVKKQKYFLSHFHFHTPSEHKINGSPYPMELHLVHKNDKGKVLKVAVFIERDKPNKLIDKIWGHITMRLNEEVIAKDLFINALELVPRKRSSYLYTGSETQSPCTEGVLWAVMKNPISLSKEQIEVFKKFYKHKSRDVQPLNERKIGDFGVL